MALEATGPNAEQIRYWNELAGPKWVALEAMIDAQIAPLGRLVMERAALAPGEHVLDVGCGCGHTTLELARRVGPGGRVVGIDLSAPMLARARALVEAGGVSNVGFEHDDAQTRRFEPESFDVVFSRFGVMFFGEPVAAFRNLRTGLRRDGRLAFVCWQGLERNPWMSVPLAAAAQHIALPPPPPAGAPGPLALADRERLHGILAAAGFADIAIEPHVETLAVGGGAELEVVVDFLLQMGPAAAAIRAAPPAALPAVAGAMRAALAPFAGPGGVRLDGAAWIVRARAVARRGPPA